MTDAPRKRLSVSAIRDYQKCARFYYWKRVKKIPDPMSHHAPAGTLMHNSFYAAYGQPLTQFDMETGRLKTSWFVHGEFTPKLALAVFDIFWNRWKEEQTFEQLLQHVQDSDYHSDPALRSELEMYFVALVREMPIVTNFRPGQLAKLGKGKKFSQKELHAGWGEYYREMLAGTVAEKLPLPVKEIEREVVWEQDGLQMLGYLDIVLDAGGGAEEGLDLKTAYNKPSEKELVIEDQMLGYYEASERHGVDMRNFYYFHMRSNTRFPIKDNPKMRRFLVQTAVQVSNKISDGDFSPRFDKENCASCTYLKNCLDQPCIEAGPFEYAIPLPMAELPKEEYVPVVLF